MKEKLMLSNKQARKNLHFRISVLMMFPVLEPVKLLLTQNDQNGDPTHNIVIGIRCDLCK